MRCSALPLATKCRGSYKLTEGYGSEQSRTGQAFHEAARAKVLKQSFDMDGLRTRYGLTDAEMDSINYGIYNIIVRIPEGAMVMADDKKLSAFGGRLTGTPDLGIYSQRVITIVDWKSGWGDVEDPETNNQTIGYAIMVLQAIRESGLSDPERIDILIVQPRLNQIKTASFTLEQLEARAKDIELIIDESDSGAGQYTTGPWCASCFKNMNCPAFAGQVKALANMVIGDGVLVDVESVLKVMLPVAKACNVVAKKVDQLAKAWVDKNGPLELPGGQSYAKIVGTDKKIDARKAFEVMGAYFDDDEKWKAMSTSMEKIVEQARKKKRGLSTVAKKALAEAGAVTEEFTVSYRIIKGGDNAGERKAVDGAERIEGDPGAQALVPRA